MSIRLYLSPIVGDGLSTQTAFRAKITDVVQGHSAQIPNNPDGSMTFTWALALAESRRAELDGRERELVSRADVLGRQAAQLETDTAALAKAIRDQADKAAAQTAAFAETARLQNRRERDLNARDEQIAAAMDDVDRQLKLTKADRSEAAALLATLRQIAADFAPLSARIAALK